MQHPAGSPSAGLFLRPSGLAAAATRRVRVVQETREEERGVAVAAIESQKSNVLFSVHPG